MRFAHILLVCLACMLISIQVGSPSHAEKNVTQPAFSSGGSILGFDDPKWGVGMEWKYTLETTSFAGVPLEMKGNVTMRINATTTIKVGNNTYNAFKFALWGGGTMKGVISGLPIQGPWFMQGASYTMTNKTANIRTWSYLNVTSNGPPSLRGTSYMLFNWTPPDDTYNFPMNLNNKWQYKGVSETYTWTYVQGLGYIQAPNKTVDSLTRNRVVTNDEYKTVPAGTFYTYLIETSSTLLNPMVGDGKEYYSNTVGNAVSIITRNKTSNATGYYNLTHTNYQPPPGKYGGINGLVQDAKGALPDVKLTFTWGAKIISTLKSDASGKYNITNLQAGTYEILANKSGYEDKSVTGIQVTAGLNTTVDITMKKPEGTLVVNVEDKANKPVADALISIKGTSNFNATTDASGKLLTVVPKGSYTVIASKQGYKSASTKADVASGATTYANLTIEALKMKLYGTVKDAKNGTGIANAIITLSQSEVKINETKSISDGNYSIMLEPGTYQVLVTCAGYINFTGNVTIEPGKNYTLDPKLSPAEKKGSGKPSESFPIWMALIPVIIIVVILVLYFMFRGKKPKQTQPSPYPANTYDSYPVNAYDSYPANTYEEEKPTS